jgi:hypothetical protein
MDFPRNIREYFIPEFSNWKDHDAYQQAFERLLRDLKDESKAKIKRWGSNRIRSNLHCELGG